MHSVQVDSIQHNPRFKQKEAVSTTILWLVFISSIITLYYYLPVIMLHILLFVAHLEGQLP